MSLFDIDKEKIIKHAPFAILVLGGFILSKKIYDESKELVLIVVEIWDRVDKQLNSDLKDIDKFRKEET